MNKLFSFKTNSLSLVLALALVGDSAAFEMNDNGVGTTENVALVSRAALVRNDEDDAEDDGLDTPETDNDGIDTTDGVLHTHIVRQGESLWRIALYYGVSMDSLVTANSLEDRDRLTVGQSLFIPGVSPDNDVNTPQAITPQAILIARAQRFLDSLDSYVNTPNDGIDTTDGVPHIHIVRQGESLWRIARYYEVSMDSLVAANSLEDRDRLTVGQPLFIPGVSSDNDVNTLQAVIPQTITPQTVTPETITPETVTPETITPETVTPETITPETITPETITPETVTPETDSDDSDSD